MKMLHTGQAMLLAAFTVCAFAQTASKGSAQGYGFEPVGGTAEQFGEYIRAEIVKWAPVVKAAGVKVD